MKRVGIIRFPGSNCDYDAFYAVANGLNLETFFIWHKDDELGGMDALIIPGGFSYGDYLRPGAIACFSKIMSCVTQFANDGGVVLGICNGFQILCEAGLLPGCLVKNTCMEFRCHRQDLAVENSTPWFNRSFLGDYLSVPIAHGSGNYRIDIQELEELEAHNQILFRYTGEKGNPNGSINQIAGIRNRSGNVFGMMPHPERAWEPFHQSQDGLKVLKAFLSSEIL